MDTDILRYTKTSFWQKIALVIFGVFLTVVIFEIGLRLGGFVLLSIQEHRNRISISKRGPYRIMCLGESTTARQHPRFLEEVLNRRNIGIKFSVIDKGVDGTNTESILSRLESNLEERHPNMVITMMGCNDRGVMYYQDIPESDSWLFRHCRVYRFSQIIYMHILKKLKKEDIYRAKSLLPSQGKSPETERSLLKAVELNPKNDRVRKP
ncbi:MAG: hypothetical protein NTZ92_02695 [Candidatus Omnitrophica bacterium]|nr:hypothetical protein [Candidatus Omnitrophota bacterium]